MEELRKVTLNFYAEDIRYLEKFVGPGWSGEIREIVHKAICEYKEGHEEDDQNTYPPGRS